MGPFDKLFVSPRNAMFGNIQQNAAKHCVNFLFMIQSHEFLILQHFTNPLNIHIRLTVRWVTSMQH